MFSLPAANWWRLGAWLVFALTQSVAATLRYRWHDRSGHFDNVPAGQASPAIFCIWHNRLALSMKTAWGETNPTGQMKRDEGEKGGHFAAWEQPQLLSEDVRAGFRSLRSGVAKSDLILAKAT